MTSSTPPLAGLCAAALLALAGCDKQPEDAAAPADGTTDAALATETANAPDATNAAGAASATDTASASDATDAANAADAATAAPSESADASAGGGGASADGDGAPERAAALPADTLGDETTLDALIDEDEIPYPVYPNGEKYRVGGENGLKIVLFETTDSFEEVDAYYGDRAEQAGMPRLAGMEDYVRYSREGDDDDPWATHRPGIVIHRFSDNEARAAVGADPDARTNIIMSY